MLRIVLGAIAGFLCWLTILVGIEKILSVISPEWLGAQQAAFEAAIENGDQFTADTGFLLVHIVCGSIVSIMSGFLAALIAGENKRSPRFLGGLLLALGLMKAVLSWPLVPVWYHIGFTAILLPMAIIGGKLKYSANVTKKRVD